MYRPNFYESTCLRCNEIVYQVDRVGPLKDFTFFHSGCFKCCHCGTKLTLKTYFNNQHKQEDKEVSCPPYSTGGGERERPTPNAFTLLVAGVLLLTRAEEWPRTL